MQGDEQSYLRDLARVPPNTMGARQDNTNRKSDGGESEPTVPLERGGGGSLEGHGSRMMGEVRVHAVNGRGRNQRDGWQQDGGERKTLETLTTRRRCNCVVVWKKKTARREAPTLPSKLKVVILESFPSDLSPFSVWRSPDDNMVENAGAPPKLAVIRCSGTKGDSTPREIKSDTGNSNSRILENLDIVDMQMRGREATRESTPATLFQGHSGRFSLPTLNRRFRKPSLLVLVCGLLPSKTVQAVPSIRVFLEQQFGILVIVSGGTHVRRIGCEECVGLPEPCFPPVRLVTHLPLSRATEVFSTSASSPACRYVLARSVSCISARVAFAIGQRRI
ncbi:hypothetical protein Bbelb_280180 [Branchiostoma belcheri]|nr:hypothetical protein Bbelb_280180 [Branchiostoma belcheri]